MNLPPRGSEDARQTLAALYAMLTSHPTPLESLGFELGSAPSPQEIDSHEARLRELFYELCDGHEEFLRHDEKLKAVRLKAQEAIA